MTGSIGGRGWDLGFFFVGGTVLALAAGAVVLVAPALVVPLWLGWLALVDGPHPVHRSTGRRVRVVELRAGVLGDDHRVGPAVAFEAGSGTVAAAAEAP